MGSPSVVIIGQAGNKFVEYDIHTCYQITSHNQGCQFYFGACSGLSIEIKYFDIGQYRYTVSAYVLVRVNIIC